jgi:acetyl-CoA acetyltransferase
MGSTSRLLVVWNRSAWCKNDHINKFHAIDDELMAMKPEMYMSMLKTAEVVASRYHISRERQDEYSLECQRRVGAAFQGGRFNDEIVPFKAHMAVMNKEAMQVSYKDVTLDKDEGSRLDTTAAGLAGIKPVFEGKTISAGNASQLSPLSLAGEGLFAARDIATAILSAAARDQGAKPAWSLACVQKESWANIVLSGPVARGRRAARISFVLVARKRSPGCQQRAHAEKSRDVSGLFSLVLDEFKKRTVSSAAR